MECLKFCIKYYNRNMEFEIEKWLEILTQELFNTFNDRVKFIGLQGSYKRGEATASSDIDAIVILDKLSFEDLKDYKHIIENMPFSEKACGFVSGEKELQNWPKHDLFQLYNDTAPLYGDLANLIPEITQNDALETVRINASTLYHMVCHCYIFDNKDLEILRSSYKMTFFIQQAKYYVKNKYYPTTKAELEELLTGEDKEILVISKNWNTLNIEDNVDFYFEKLMNWCSELLKVTA